MYYCKICGCRSQGDFCANRRCKDFCMAINPRNQFPSSATTPPSQKMEQFSNPIDPCSAPPTAFPIYSSRSAAHDYASEKLSPSYCPNTNNVAPSLPRCDMPFPPCNDELTLAFAVTPFQKFEKIYPVAKGLMAGTIFPKLDLPYKERKILGEPL